MRRPATCGRRLGQTESEPTWSFHRLRSTIGWPAHEFATPPIAYNLASSTGPAWTLGELLALGGEG